MNGMTKHLLYVKTDVQTIDEWQNIIDVRQIAESLLKTYTHCFSAFIVEKCKVWPAITIIIVSHYSATGAVICHAVNYESRKIDAFEIAKFIFVQHFFFHFSDCKLNEYHMTKMWSYYRTPMLNKTIRKVENVYDNRDLNTVVESDNIDTIEHFEDTRCRKSAFRFSYVVQKKGRDANSNRNESGAVI